MLIAEIKKLLNWSKLFTLFLLFVLFYFMFFKANVGILNKNGSLSIQHEVSKEMIRKYGAVLDEQEYNDFCKNMPTRTENAIDRWIQERNQYTNLGITTFEEFEKSLNKLPENTAMLLSSDLNIAFSQEEQDKIRTQLFKIQYFEILMEKYKQKVDKIDNSNLQNRLNKIYENEWKSLMPDYPIIYYLRLLSDFLLFIVISIIVLIIPYCVKDNISNIKPILYSSRCGRKLYKIKKIAAFISALLIMTVEIIILLVFTWKNGFLYFRECYVSGFCSSFLTSIPITFGEYIILSIAIILLFSIILECIIFFFAQISSNYTTAAAWQLPVIVCTLIFSIKIITHLFDISQNILVPAIFIPGITAVILTSSRKFPLFKRKER